VEPTDDTMIMGDPFFRKWVVLHDLTDLKHKKMGLAPRNPAYRHIYIHTYIHTYI
jgi:hypothetical protein